MILWVLIGVGMAQGTPAAGADTMRLAVEVDDRAVRRLQHPVLRVSAEGAAPVPLVDDGSIPEDTPNDEIWVAVQLVRRTQKLELRVEDGGTTLGPLAAFLPSSDTAGLRVRTTEESPGLSLTSEASATSGGAASGSVAAAAGGGEDDARIARVLWVAIVLFAVAFGYTRNVLFRRYTDEVKPVLGRLDAWLSSQEKHP